jgi:hypothetical protein
MFRAPRNLPSFEFLMADLATSPEALAKHLGVDRRTVFRWVAQGEAPRPVMLSLFWESRWGRSLSDSTAYNEAQVHRNHAKSLARQVTSLMSIIEDLQKVLPEETANHPLFDINLSAGSR